MKYLQCVIKEAMRLYAVVPYLTRVSDEDIEIEVGGHPFVMSAPRGGRVMEKQTKYGRLREFESVNQLPNMDKGEGVKKI